MKNLITSRNGTKNSNIKLPYLVSIITVCYNAEQFLEETIQSVIEQDYPNLEYVIVDGGSTDSTLAIIEKYRAHIDVFVSEPDCGIYDAINKGLRLCSGLVIKIQNADDILLEGAVSAAMEMLSHHRIDEPTIVIGYSRVIDIAGSVLARITERPIYLGFDSFNHPGWFATASVYEMYGLYSLEYKIASDYEYYLRFKIGGGRIFWMPRDVVSYRQDGASSGFDGVREVTLINRHYYGNVRAWIVRIQHQGGKILRPLKRWVRTLERMGATSQA